MYPFSQQRSMTTGGSATTAGPDISSGSAVVFVATLLEEISIFLRQDLRRDDSLTEIAMRWVGRHPRTVPVNGFLGFLVMVLPFSNQNNAVARRTRFASDHVLVGDGMPCSQVSLDIFDRLCAMSAKQTLGAVDTDLAIYNSEGGHFGVESVPGTLWFPLIPILCLRDLDPT